MATSISSLYSAKPTFMCLDKPEVIPDSLMPKEKVQELILFGQPIADEHIANIARAAARNHFLSGIRLEHQRIGAPALRAVAESFASNTNLKCLCLRYSHIDDAGAAELANLVGDSKSLIALDLSFNNIGDAGADVLARALSSGSVLQFLDLRWNNIQDRGGEQLHNVRVNGTCKTILLDGNRGNIVETPQAEKKVKKSMKSQVMRSMKSTSSPVTYDYDFEVGDTVELPGEGGVGDNRIGICAYIGKTKFADGVWVGVKFEKPIGKNDGSVSGKTYFKCAKFHGSFVRPEHVTLVEKKGDGGGGLDSSTPLRESSDSNGAKSYGRRSTPGSVQVKPMLPEKPKGGMSGGGGATASPQLMRENQDLRARVAQLEAKIHRLQGSTGDSTPIPRLDDVPASAAASASAPAKTSQFRSSPNPSRLASPAAPSPGMAARRPSPSLPGKPSTPPKPSIPAKPSVPAKPSIPAKPTAPPKPGGPKPTAPPKPVAPPKPGGGSSDEADLRQSEVLGKGFEGRTAVTSSTTDHTAIEGSFQVKLRTASGEQVSCGGHNMKAMITGPRGQVIEARCADNGNGTYDFTYSVMGPGDYTIIITCDSAPVADSPYIKSFFVPKEKKKRPVSMGLKRNPFKSK